MMTSLPVDKTHEKLACWAVASISQHIIPTSTTQRSSESFTCHILFIFIFDCNFIHAQETCSDIFWVTSTERRFSTIVDNKMYLTWIIIVIQTLVSVCLCVDAVIRLQLLTGSTNSNYWWFLFPAALQDGNPEVSINNNISFGVVGRNLTAGFHFPAGTWKMLCRGECKGGNILINTTDEKHQSHRYSTEYVIVQYAPTLSVSITQLIMSDAGQYSCGVGGSPSSVSYRQFEVVVAEGEFQFKLCKCWFLCFVFCLWKSEESFVKLWKLWDFYFTSAFYQFSESMTLNKLLFTKLCFLNCSYVYNYGKEHSCHNLHHVRMMWVNRAAQNIRHSMKRRSCGGAVWAGDNNTLCMRLANMIYEVSSKWSADLFFVVELDFMSMN